nr:type II toxin-antitoxin system RelE/ParE family toxin [uncultured Pseudoxanthomonas sp.]
MTWTVEATPEVGQFLREELTDAERVEVYAVIRLLEQFGPNLPRPHSGTLRDDDISKLKELRIPYKEKQFRILYAFDSERNGILLVGGDKVPLGEKLWYPKFIKEAKELLEKHEAQIAMKNESKKVDKKQGKKEKRRAR